MRKIAVLGLVVLGLVAVIVLGACERTLQGDERAAVLAFSEPAMDNLLAGLAANDYAAYSRDFDSDMFERAPAASFAAWKKEVDASLGRYLARSVDQVKKSDEFYVVVYRAEFELEPEVLLAVAFHADQTIAFLSLESEGYAWSAWE